MKIFVICSCMLMTGPWCETFAQGSALRREQFHVKDGVMLYGYDPVSFHTEGKAIKGKKEFAVRAEGVVYHLSSEKNKQLFLKDYEKYEPRYGGWCAYAMGNSGEKVEIDPETFKIIDGKLYVFYNAFFNNTLNSWNKDESRLKKQADANWKNFIPADGE